MRIDKSFLGCFEDPDNGIKLKRRHKTRGVCIHHTCTASPKKTRDVLKKMAIARISRSTETGKFKLLSGLAVTNGTVGFALVMRMN